MYVPRCYAFTSCTLHTSLDFDIAETIAATAAASHTRSEYSASAELTCKGARLASTCAWGLSERMLRMQQEATRYERAYAM